MRFDKTNLTKYERKRLNSPRLNQCYPYHQPLLDSLCSVCRRSGDRPPSFLRFRFCCLSFFENLNLENLKLIEILTLSVFWKLKMSILPKRSVAMTAHKRHVKLEFLLLFKHKFNIQNNNYLNFSKFYSIKNDFDPKIKIKNIIEMI